MACRVVLVNVDGAPAGRTEQARGIRQFPTGWTDLVPELNQQPEDYTVTKREWGAFTNTGLEEHLKNLGVTQVVIAGVATSIGVGCGLALVRPDRQRLLIETDIDGDPFLTGGFEFALRLKLARNLGLHAGRFHVIEPGVENLDKMPPR
jgi:hypothetical protein